MTKINKKIFISVVIFLLGLFLIIISKPLFEENKPISVIFGVFKLCLTDADIVKIGGQENKYISKSHVGEKPITNLLGENGYLFKDQFGSGYVFENLKREQKTAVRKQFSRWFVIWSVN